MKPTRILVAEDDTNIREGVVDLFTSEGWEVTAAADGEEALKIWSKGGFDLLVLDVMMPGRSGYDVCREVRRTDARVPVIMLTAKSEEIDKVIGLELGADDYVTKPFGVRELLARVHAILRRSRATASAAADALPDVFSFGTAEINRTTLRGKLGKTTFDLTPRELQILEFFQARPGMAVSREKLLRGVWGYDYFGTTRTVDQHIAQLRKKIEPDPANPTVLTTVHGLGYRYEAPPAEEC